MIGFQGAVLLLCLWCFGCAGAAQQRVLFVGNSYTAVNNLPDVYKKVAESMLPGTTVTVESITPGGVTLYEHHRNAQTKARVEQGGYDFLVVQDQSLVGGYDAHMIPHDPDAPQDEWRRPSCVAVAELFAPAAVRHGATLVLYQTWGRRAGDQQYFPKYYGTYKSMQRMLKDGYAILDDNARRRGGANDTQSLIARCGETFEAVYDAAVKAGNAAPGADAGSLFYRLYSGDASHPSMLGTFAAAHTLFATMNQAQKGMWAAADASFRPAGVSEAEALLLIQYARGVSAPVSPALRALQGLYLQASSQWPTYILRGRKLIMTSVRPGKEPVPLDIDDSGQVPQARINGTVVQLTSDGERLMVGAQMYLTYYNQRYAYPSYTPGNGTCQLHASEATCQASPSGVCVWYNGACSRPCNALIDTCGVYSVCQRYGVSDGVSCSSTGVWASVCKDASHVQCRRDARCLWDHPVCSSRCEALGSEASCVADNICVWSGGKCEAGPCGNQETKADCSGQTCVWHEGATGGNGDGLCRSPCLEHTGEGSCAADSKCFWNDWTAVPRCAVRTEIIPECSTRNGRPPSCKLAACIVAADSTCQSMCRLLDGNQQACETRHIEGTNGLRLTCSYDAASQVCEQKTPKVPECWEISDSETCNDYEHGGLRGCEWNGALCQSYCEKYESHPAPTASDCPDCYYDASRAFCGRSECEMASETACLALSRCRWHRGMCWLARESCAYVANAQCKAEGCELRSDYGWEWCHQKPWVPPTTPPPSSSPDTIAPPTSAPATSSPDMTAPITSVPDTTARTTSSPVTSSPDTTAPTTAVPDTIAPPTSAPATSSPDTTAATTSSPDTIAPPTSAPATPSPDTTVPTTSVPDATARTTSVPDTIAPPTSAPATSSPDTTAPTASSATIAPHTSSPAPTTFMHDTRSPPTAPTASSATSTPRTSPPATSQPGTTVPTTPGPVPPALMTSSPRTQPPATSTPRTALPDTSAPTTESATGAPASPPSATPVSGASAGAQRVGDGDSGSDGSGDDTWVIFVVVGVLVLLVGVAVALVTMIVRKGSTPQSHWETISQEELHPSSGASELMDATASPHRLSYL